MNVIKTVLGTAYRTARASYSSLGERDAPENDLETGLGDSGLTKPRGAQTLDGLGVVVDQGTQNRSDFKKLLSDYLSNDGFDNKAYFDCLKKMINDSPELANCIMHMPSNNLDSIIRELGVSPQEVLADIMTVHESLQRELAITPSFMPESSGCKSVTISSLGQQFQVDIEHGSTFGDLAMKIFKEHGARIPLSFTDTEGESLWDIVNMNNAVIESDTIMVNSFSEQIPPDAEFFNNTINLEILDKVLKRQGLGGESLDDVECFLGALPGSVINEVAVAKGIVSLKMPPKLHRDELLGPYYFGTHALSLLPEQLRDNEEVVLVATETGNVDFMELSSNMKENRTVAKSAVTRNPAIMTFVSPKLKRDEAFLLDVFKSLKNPEKGGDMFLTMPVELKCDIVFMAKFVAIHSSAVKCNYKFGKLYEEIGHDEFMRKARLEAGRREAGTYCSTQ